MGKELMNLECCTCFFFAHKIGEQEPVIVLECSRCGRLWYRRDCGDFVEMVGSLALGFAEVQQDVRMRYTAVDARVSRAWNFSDQSQDH